MSRPTTRDLAARSLRAQRDALVASEPRVVAGEPDAVHQSRVAVRRLRSTLRTFRAELAGAEADAEAADADGTRGTDGTADGRAADGGFDSAADDGTDGTADGRAGRPETGTLRDELRWWGGVLGAARDAEVERDRVTAVLAGLPADPRVAGARSRLVESLDGGYRAAHAAVVAQVVGPESARYRAMLARLDAAVARAETPGGGSRSARRVARDADRRARRRERDVRALLAGDGLADVPDPLDPALAEALHALRKAAKTARYAGEVLAPATPRATAFAEAFEHLQDVLGEHHDAVALVALLTADAAHEAWSGAFTDGVLVGVERARAADALAAYPAAWAATRAARWWR